MWLAKKIHVACVSERFTLKIQFSAGNRHDAPEDQKFIESLSCKAECYLFMDRVYEDNKTQALALMQELILVVPSNNSRKFP